MLVGVLVVACEDEGAGDSGFDPIPCPGCQDAGTQDGHTGDCDDAACPSALSCVHYTHRGNPGYYCLQTCEEEDGPCPDHLVCKGAAASCMTCLDIVHVCVPP
jgi:hypothetical protein